jgi:hypothetical protein
MKRLVSDFHALDILELARGCRLQPFSKYDWVWRTHNGTQETSVTITVLKDSLGVMFSAGGHRVHPPVWLTYSIGPHGGTRPCFVCPTCPRRVGVLYHTDGLPFRCRICWDLTYPSQYRSRDRRYGRQLRGLSHQERDRLSAQCGVRS